MRGPSPQQASIGALRQAREALLRTIAETELRSRTAMAAGRRATADVDSLSHTAIELRSQLHGIDTRIAQAVSTFLAPPPQTLIHELDGAIPILLMPVRIETRFRSTRDDHQLLVRIFPDDVMVTAHDPTLSKNEYEAAVRFWQEVAAAVRLEDEERRPAEDGASSALIDRFGEPRATWIAMAARPQNWNEATPPAPEALVFPPLPPIHEAGSLAPPRSRVMPDRFVVMTFDGSERIHEVVGAPLRDDLILGPDPLSLEGQLHRGATGNITAGPRLRWLFDFPTAVADGLAVRIPLNDKQVTRGFDKIVVLGVRATTDAEASARLVAELMEAHRFTRGFDILPQGTPTKSTDEARSGFDGGMRRPGDIAGAAAAGRTGSGPPIGSDGRRVADALGLELQSLGALLSGRQSDVSEALAMARALWPATLGHTLDRFLTPPVSVELAREFESFALAHVTGVGPLPAIRVGRQPYGILTTSSLDKWEPDKQTALGHPLHAGLKALARQWERLLPGVASISAANADTQAFMSTIGLQPSSVSWHRRFAVTDMHTWNLLAYSQMDGTQAGDGWKRAIEARRAALTSIGLSPEFLDSGIEALTFLGAADTCNGPVVDGDPELPLSESDELRKLDGRRNYIDWLLSAPYAEIESQAITGADGQRLTAPRALLYLYLRHAWLAELGRSARAIAMRKGGEGFKGLQPSPDVINIGDERSLTDSDLLGLDASRLGLMGKPQPLGDWLSDRARMQQSSARDEPEVTRLAQWVSAARLLARAPTARLERLFAGQIDTCSYRLDAWHLGLFGERLAQLRQPTANPRGIYIGAYGYVENLRPDKARREATQAPPALADMIPTGQTAFRQSSNGGYIHAPSLTHAVTAAILRNGHISHASVQNPDVMSVNLSSRRVRNALALIDGLRNGQEIAALLGYQLERGLHEGHPHLLLDDIIYRLRELFPLVPRTPEESAGTTVEGGRLRNVVNGFDLLEATRGKTYPYDIAGLPTQRDKVDAIATEIDRLADAMDSVADLMLAEGVHQVVQGNYERTQGVLHAMGEAGLPPIPEIVKTPRSGHSITQRLAVFLPEGGGWITDPDRLTPRARANPRVNAWLAAMLPPPGDIVFGVKIGASPPVPVAMSETGLDAIDVVLTCGQSFGDNSSMLERHIVDHIRSRPDVAPILRFFFREKSDPDLAEELALVIDPAAGATGKWSLESLLPLLRWLRQLITTSRPLHAGDFRSTASGSDIDPANPKGFDGLQPELARQRDLAERTAAVIAALAEAAADLDGILHRAEVVALTDAFARNPDQISPLAWSEPLGQIHAQLRQIALFGMREAIPASPVDLRRDSIAALIAQAEAVAVLAARRATEARALATEVEPPVVHDGADAAFAQARAIEARIERLTKALRLALGGDLIAVPQFAFSPAQQSEIDAAAAALPPGLSHMTHSSQHRQHDVVVPAGAFQLGRQ